MPDGYFENLPIPYNVKPDPTYLAETKADKSTTINGYDLSEDRTLFVQDVPSKNLLPNTASTTTINGITFTVNDDGSVTVNGTATADAYLVVKTFSASEASALNGMILNGCPSTGGENKYFIILQQLGSQYNTYGWDTGSGSVISGANDQARALVYIKSGQTLSNIVFCPMIRLASVEDDTYVPYAKTNVELTNDIKSTENDIEATQNQIGVINVGITYVSSMELSNLGAWMRSNMSSNAWHSVRFAPQSGATQGYFGSSSVIGLCYFIGANYGCAMLMSDQANNVVFGTYALGTWTWRHPTLTTVS